MKLTFVSRARSTVVAVGLLLMLFADASWCQIGLTQPASPETKAETSSDTLGRDTPRGAVLGFLSAARNGNAQIAALYLNTSLRGPDAEVLALELATVLDRKLPAKLNELNNETEGSLRDQLSPDEDVVGTISTHNGDLDILVERVDRGKAGRVWLFSRKTLDAIPGVYRELSTPAVESI